ncbi:MAG: hypothetical protein ACRCTZ_00180 [Sarcina sp.]
MKMKCTSRNIGKLKMPIKFKSGFSKVTMLARIKHSEFIKNIFSFKLSRFQTVKMNCKSGQMFKITSYNCKSLNTNAYTKAAEYLIDSPVILEDVITFRNTANSFVKLFNMSGGRKLINKNDNPFLILQFHQNNIKSIEQFRKMKLEDVITDELFYALTCL